MKRCGSVAEDAVEIGVRAEPAGNAERMPLFMRSVLAAYFKKGRVKRSFRRGPFPPAAGRPEKADRFPERGFRIRIPLFSRRIGAEDRTAEEVPFYPFRFGLLCGR